MKRTRATLGASPYVSALAGPVPLVLLLLALLLLPPATPGPSGALPVATAQAPSAPGLAAPAAPSAPSAPASTSAPGPRGVPSILPPTDGWLQYQGDVQRDGQSPDAPPATTHVAWSVALPTVGTGASTISGGLVSSAGIVYVPSSNDAVYALDGRNGSLLWSYSTHGPLGAAPVVDRGLLLVASADSYLYELNATTGTLVLKIPLWLPDNASSPLALGPNVVVPCKAKGVHALCEFALSNGAQLWNASVGDLLAAPSADPANDLVFAASITGDVYAIHLSTGALAWNYSFGGAYTITSSPVVGSVGSPAKPYVFSFASSSTTSSELAGFNESSPTTSVRHPFFLRTGINYGIGAATPVLTSTALYAATETGRVVALDPTNGSNLWVTQPWGGNSNMICSSPLDAAGTLLIGVPGVANCGSGGGELAELATSDGKVVATVPSPTGSIVASLAITSTAVYFGANDGHVYAVGTTPPDPPQSLAATSLNGSLAVSWKAPANTGGIPITQYALFWGRPWGPYLSTTLPVGTTQYNVTSLTNGLSYEVIVEAVNNEGASPNATTTSTPQALPYPPQGVHVLLSDHSFTLAWSPPTSNGGFNITGYVVSTWNASTWVHQNLTVPAVSSGTSWTLKGVPDGVDIFAQVAAVTLVGQGNSSAVVAGAPYLAPGIVTFVVNPVSVRGSVSLSVQGVGVPVPSGNGTVRLTFLPGTYWVNASASGYQAYDEQVVVSSGASMTLYVNLTTPSRNPLQLSTEQVVGIVVVVLVALVLGMFLVARHYRKLRAISEPEEDDTEEGISESRARSILQPAAPAAGEEGTEEASSAPLAPEEGELAGAEPPALPTPEVEEETAPEEEPEGPGGRLGEMIQRRRAGKETLKNSEANTPEQ